MFNRLFKCFIIMFVLLFSIQHKAQINKANPNKNNSKKNPETFSISKTDFDKLFTFKSNQVINISQNIYLDKSVSLLNTKNGDMIFLKIKLNYFKKAYLLVQINGSYSTQIFILSDDKSIFYKGKLSSTGLLMTKCLEEEIVSE